VSSLLSLFENVVLILLISVVMITINELGCFCYLRRRSSPKLDVLGKALNRSDYEHVQYSSTVWFESNGSEKVVWRLLFMCRLFCTMGYPEVATVL
jgi:hypothetical protein